jgi:hypothetical protein
VIVDSDTEAPEPSYRIGEPDIDPAPDLHRFSVLAGEVLYHLRSSLDLLVWQLILRNGRDPASLHPLPEFSIYRDRQKYKSEGVRKIHGVSPFAKAVIDEAQPYAGSGRGYSDEALWNVHQLNIQDKHRLLSTVVGFDCDWLERVLDVALHHQRPHFIARSFGPNNGDSPDDGIALDRWMADLLGHAR